MAKTIGWSPKGQLLIDHAPFGHRKTQKFIATLHPDRLDAPWICDDPQASLRLIGALEPRLWISSINLPKASTALATSLS